MAKNRCPAPEECEECDELMATFADLMSLLMAFFVLLLSMANFDPAKYGEVAEGMKESFARIVTTAIQEPLTGPTKQEKEAEQSKKKDATGKAMDAVGEMISERGVEEFVKMTKTPGGFELELANNSLFSSGSANLQRTIKPVLTQLARTIAAVDGAQMEVQGHTDDDPIHTEKFPSNWELSSVRAINVLKFMTSHGMNPKRVKAAAFADSQPKVPNRDKRGRPIKKNQAENRRVIIKVDKAVEFEKPAEGADAPAWQKQVKVKGGKRVDKGKKKKKRRSKRKKKKEKNR
ncbi:MAG: flagellar motor protein MotB [Gammaproteobacteria bacterium]|jgi:chemotaxis protein MotB|nr:flagellar motor protein MotB [Gammaproteobacteria bacterium]